MTAYKKVFSNRPFIGTVIFLAFLYFLEEWFFGFPQLLFYRQVIAFGKPADVLIALISGLGSFAMCYLIVLAALVSSRPYQIVYIFLFGLASLVQYGFWKAVGRFLSSADLRIAAATPLNTWEGAGAIYFDWHFFFPVLGFLAVLFLFSAPQPLKSSLTKLGLALLLTILLNVAYIFTDKNLSLGTSFSSFYQTITRYSIDEMFPARRELVNYISQNIPQDNIVLIIDESIRGDHLGINGYSRDTTPFLQQLSQNEEGFHNFGLAVAGATCSYPSNALILTGVRPGVDDFKLVEDHPTIFQYAQAMGYKTYYIDAQTNSLWNGLTDHDLSFIDSWTKAAELGEDLEKDLHAADRIRQIALEGTGNFIVLNKRGVHFLYESSYPKDAAVWLPLPTDYTQLDRVANSYDNGILYNVNSFFERLLTDRQVLEHTTILYTSDHGQTLFENHASWLHCNYTLPEATVPLILIGRHLPAVDTGYHASHSNILPTILDLMKVPMEQRAHDYAASLFSASKDMFTDHFFFDGALRLIDFPDQGTGPN